jgi:hypothetical protein
VGVRHALFPRSLTFGAQLHPSSVVGCQFPDAAAVCMNDCNPFRPRSEASLRCHHHGRFRVRLLSPDFPAPAGAFCPNPVRMPLRLDASGPVCPRSASGSLRIRSFALGDGSCLLPLKSHFWFSCGRLLVGKPTAHRILLRLRGHRRGFRRLPGGVLNPRRPDPFSTFRLRHRTVSAAGFVRSKPPDDGLPHWLTVATDRSCLTDCVRPGSRNLGTGGHDSARGWFVRSVPLVCRITGSTPLAA